MEGGKSWPEAPGDARKPPGPLLFWPIWHGMTLFICAGEWAGKIGSFSGASAEASVAGGENDGQIMGKYVCKISLEEEPHESKQ